MSEWSWFNITGLLMVLLLLGMEISLSLDQYISKRRKGILTVILILNFLLFLLNVLSYALLREYAQPSVRTAVLVLEYSVRPVISLLFCYLLRSRGAHPFWWVLIGVNTLINATAFFSHLCFWIDAANQYHDGPLRAVGPICTLSLLGYLLYLTVFGEDHSVRDKLWVPVFVVLILFGGVVVERELLTEPMPISISTVTIVVGTYFFCIWLKMQFLREHLHAIRTEQQVQVMMSQIQPHFLFNTLATIQALCRIDPGQAAHVTERFGTFLRQNLESINNSALIPLAQELEHTRIYTEIEMIRFPNIQVDYDIGDEDFSLPALTIQPMVENAIRHGVRIREDGKITVSTREQPGCHEIVIRDNGVGFDPSDPELKEARHIGLHAVKERVEHLAGGSMRIDSRVGAGTEITIRIPKNKQQKEAGPHESDLRG